jgi:hypothetical protein
MTLGQFWKADLGNFSRAPKAIQVIAHLHRPKQSQELGFNMHSPLRTCMALPPPEVNPPFRSRLQKLNEQALSFQQTELF